MRMFEKQSFIIGEWRCKLSPCPSLKNIEMDNAIKIYEIHVTKIAVKVNLLTPRNTVWIRLRPSLYASYGDGIL
jgi:hypothetical protein